MGVRKRTSWPSTVEAPSIASPDRDQAWNEPFKLWIEMSPSPSCKLGTRPKSQFSDSWAQHLSAGVWNKLIFFSLMALITDEIRYFSFIYLVSTLATWCKVLTHWKRPWCWERLKVGGEGDDRGWDGWIASPTRWTWVWASSRSWWCTRKPDMLQSTGLQSQTRLSDWTMTLSVYLPYFSENSKGVERVFPHS